MVRGQGDEVRVSGNFTENIVHVRKFLFQLHFLVISMRREGENNFNLFVSYTMDTVVFFLHMNIFVNFVFCR